MLAARVQEWIAAHEPLGATAEESPQWSAWADRVEGLGTLRRITADAAEAMAIAADASRVLEQLPADGVSLPVLANTVLVHCLPYSTNTSDGRALAAVASAVLLTPDA